MSRFIFLRRFVVDMLDLDLYRCDLDPTAFPSPSDKSNDSVGPFWIVSGWLRYAGAFLVSHFVFLRWIDLYRSEFDAAAASLMSNVSEATFQIVLGWLCRSQRVIVSQVGVFDFWRLVDVYRSDLDPSVLPTTRNVSIWTLCRMDRWHGRHW